MSAVTKEDIAQRYEDWDGKGKPGWVCVGAGESISANSIINLGLGLSLRKMRDIPSGSFELMVADDVPEQKTKPAVTRRSAKKSVTKKDEPASSSVGGDEGDGGREDIKRLGLEPVSPFE